MIDVPFEMHEVLAMIAPRPRLLSTSDEDFVFPNDGWSARRTIEKLKPVYELLGTTENLESYFFSGGHSFPEEASRACVRLAGEETEIAEMNVLLAIDGGGSRTRCLAISDDGKIIGSGKAGPSNHLLVDRGIVAESLRSAIQESLRASGLDATAVGYVVAGLAGVDYDGTGANEMRALFSEIGFETVLIEGDMVIAHAGALAGRPGVLALAGTGSSILGIAEDGDRVKVGGWGPVFGDEGSAYRMGQNALRAAARDFDGRGPSTQLTVRVVEGLGLANFQGSIDAVYLDDMQPREIARLSTVVDAVARAGDEVALGILTTAGVELAECVAAAIRRMKMADESVMVSYQGSVVLNCDLMRESFCESLTRDFPTVQIEPPRFPPVIGAYLLGRAANGLANDDRLFSALEEGIAATDDDLC